MARIFISHSSHNNEIAIQVRDWLISQGWDDIFLDLDPLRGIAAGERWKNALQKAAHRCEVVLALVSKDWLASPWCKAEINAAQLINKKVFVALIGGAPQDVPMDLADEQWVDLLQDPAGYERLREGLRRAGLNPASFPFAEGRRPYPGFSAFEEEDAAIFFGREAQVVRALDKLRGMVRTGVERMLVVLAASGAGKSSFLRAGLMPRLRRDDRSWLPLPPIRPERATLSGKFGLAQSLRSVMAEPRFAKHACIRALPQSRSCIQSKIESPGGLREFLEALREAARVTLVTPGTPPPTVVIAVDQAEEVFNEEGRDEARQFIDLLTRELGGYHGAVALLAIRTDAFPELQADPLLAECPKELFTLDRMLPGAYRTVIVEPARMVRPKPVELDPQLVDALLADVSGQDALPLLAFTLWRLNEEYAANGRLTLEDYNRSGRIRGAIRATADCIFEEGSRAGILPQERPARLALLRRVFVPHLVQVNPAEQFVRRVANEAEIGRLRSDARLLVDRLVESRLLIRDHRPVSGRDQDVFEVAHEALFREWEDLAQVLQGERAFLSAKAYLAQAAKDWAEAPDEQRRGLLLSGSRLERARAWAKERRDELSELERRFIEEGARLADWQKRLAQMSAAGLAGLGIVAAGLGGWGYTVWRENQGECYAANLYAVADTRFERHGSEWHEINRGHLFATYRETHRDPIYVYLAQPDREGANGRNFLVRIPKCGGMVAWSWSNPIFWSDFQIVQRGSAEPAMGGS